MRQIVNRVLIRTLGICSLYIASAYLIFHYFGDQTYTYRTLYVLLFICALAFAYISTHRDTLDLGRPQEPGRARPRGQLTYEGLIEEIRNVIADSTTRLGEEVTILQRSNEKLLNEIRYLGTLIERMRKGNNAQQLQFFIASLIITIAAVVFQFLFPGR